MRLFLSNSLHISVLFSIRSNLPNSQLTDHGNAPHCFSPAHSISAAFRKAIYETSFSHLSTLIHWVAKGNDLPLDARETRWDWQEMMWYNYQCGGFMDIRADKCVHYQYGCHMLCIPTENIRTSCQSVPSLLVLLHTSFLLPKNTRPADSSLCWNTCSCFPEDSWRRTCVESEL